MKKLVFILFFSILFKLNAADLFVTANMGIVIPGVNLNKYVPSLNFGLSAGFYTEGSFAFYLSYDLSPLSGKANTDFYPISGYNANFILRPFLADIDPYFGFHLGVSELTETFIYTPIYLEPNQKTILENDKVAAQIGLIAGCDFSLSTNVKFFSDARFTYFDFKHGGTHWIIHSGLKCFF